MTISSPSASSASPAPLASGKPDRESGCVACPPACDCHFHVFTASQSSPGARYQPAYTASFGDWRALSGKAGIGRGIVVQPSFLGVDNRVLLQTLQQAPEALRGVAVVSGEINQSDLRQLYEAGVRGIRLNLMGMNDDAEHLRALSSAWWGNLMASGTPSRSTAMSSTTPDSGWPETASTTVPDTTAEAGGGACGAAAPKRGCANRTTTRTKDANRKVTRLIRRSSGLARGVGLRRA